jgi:tetratricopeptide (TPR) repeat protein
MIVVLAVLIIAGGCATTTQTVSEHSLVVQREIELQDTKSNLYWLAHEWMEKTLIDSDEAIQYQNEKKGVIVGQGVIEQKSRFGESDVVYDYLIELTVEVKDNYAKTTIESPYGYGYTQENIGIFTEPHLMPREDYEELKAKFYSVIEDLFSFMKKDSIAFEYNDKGIAKANAGDYEGAIKDFTKAIELYPDFPSSYDNRGITKARIGDYEGAIKDFTKAIELKPDYPTVYYGRGLSKAYIGDYEGAINDFTKAIELDPNYVSAYNNRGNAKTLIGEYEGAIADYTKAIELNPEHINAYTNLGNAKSSTGDYEGAIEDHTKAIELDPAFADAYNNRGCTYIKMERYLDAVSDLDEALTISEKSYYYDARGWAYFFLGKLEEARQDAISALELDSEAYNCRALLYRIEVQKGNREKALASLKNYISKYEEKDIKDNYFLILKYFANEITLDDLKNNPEWEDLKVALKYYLVSDN